MFLLPHILFIVITLIVTVGLLIGLSYIKNQKIKDILLKTFAIATFVIHISIMWVDYLKFGKAEAYDNILFPIYFCNFAMYLLIICAFIKNKQSKLFKIFATFIAYAGFFGALITIFITPFEIPTSYERVKSLLSHVTLLWGCIYLFVGGYVKIHVFNIIPYTMGLLGSGVIGVAVNLIFKWANLPMPNAMYLLHGPSEAPMMSCWIIAGIMLVLIFAFTVIYEMFAYKKEDRFYKSHKSLGEYFKIK